MKNEFIATTGKYIVGLLVLTVSTSATFANNEQEEDYIRKAAQLRPSPRQIAWQELEFIAFVHFGVNTFTDTEWGNAKEDPPIFNPIEFDADQWVRACKAAGMKMIILTAKHLDGFCLWHSKYSEHSVKKSPWKNGKGDIVREVAQACRKGGLKFGFYLSPWDRHEPSYGDSPRYNEFFKNQLRELLTNYGEVSEVWFDGAGGEGPNGKRQIYDWAGYYQLIRKLQPNAVIAICGPDVRWCGNEAGRTRQSEWSVVPIKAQNKERIAEDFTQYNEKHASFGVAQNDFTPGEPAFRNSEANIGGRKKIRNAKQLVWFPAEVNTSIRPGWFYHASQDNKVKSLEHLLDIYYGSVGGNAVFLLNIPPDQRGLFHENDVKRLAQLGQVIKAAFNENIAAKVHVKASHIRDNNPNFGPDKIVDGDKNTYWTTDDGITAATIELNLGKEKTFNRAMLQEYIKVGQRIEAFVLEVWANNQWREIDVSTTVGYKRLLRFPDVTTDRVRIKITESRLCPTLSNVGLYFAPPINDILKNHTH